MIPVAIPSAWWIRSFTKRDRKLQRACNVSDFRYTVSSQAYKLARYFEAYLNYHAFRLVGRWEVKIIEPWERLTGFGEGVTEVFLIFRLGDTMVWTTLDAISDYEACLRHGGEFCEYKIQFLIDYMAYHPGKEENAP